jgi:hypothetical protein
MFATVIWKINLEVKFPNDSETVSAMSRRQCGASTFKSPTVRSNVDVLLDQVPNRGGDNQGHQFGPPVLEEEAFHGIKASYLVPAECYPRCSNDRFRVAAVRTNVSRTVPI